MKIPNLPKGTLLYICWDDHSECNGWRDPSYIPGVQNCASMGFLHCQDTNKIAIAQTINWDGPRKPKDYMILNSVSEIQVILKTDITDWWEIV